MKSFTFICSILLIIFIGYSSSPYQEWNEENGYRWADLQLGFFEKTGIEMLSFSKTGIHFRNDVRLNLIKENRHYLNESGVAFSDFSKNGKMDLVVSQNNGQSMLYKYNAEKSGTRVELIVTKGNRNTIEASIHLLYQGGSKGPACFN